jgi:hypothetical protein
MAGKTNFLEGQLLNRILRRLTTAVSGANGSTTNILVTSSTGFVPGDIVKLTTPGSYHLVTAVPDGTHVTISPAAASAPTTGNVEAWAWSPAAVYVGLFTANPTDAGGGTEVSGGNYARQQVAQADASWAAPSGTPRSTNNSSAIAWNGVTWSGTVTGWGIFDAATGGNLLAWFDSADKTVNSGDNVQFAAAALAWQED